MSIENSWLGEWVAVFTIDGNAELRDSRESHCPMPFMVLWVTLRREQLGHDRCQLVTHFAHGCYLLVSPVAAVQPLPVVVSVWIRHKIPHFTSLSSRRKCPNESLRYKCVTLVWLGSCKRERSSASNKQALPNSQTQKLKSHKPSNRQHLQPRCHLLGNQTPQPTNPKD